MKRLLLENVLQKLNVLYPQYDYSLITEYKNNASKVSVICPKHGEFQTTVMQLLRNDVEHPCPICRRESGNLLGVSYLDTSDFISEYFRRWPNSVYDLSKVKYTTANSNVIVFCKRHNKEFTCKAYKLMANECVCKDCVQEHRTMLYKDKMTNKYKDWLTQEKDMLNDFGIQYDIEESLHELVSESSHNFHKTPITLVCSNHGVFRTTIGQVIKFTSNEESPCVKCRGKFVQRNYTTDEFVQILKQLYSDKEYSYDKVNYVDYKTKVIITCPIHGDFSRLPQRLMEGRGCPYCVESLLERRLRCYFDDIEMKYIYQYRNPDILGKKILDFFLPDYSVGIECQGKQHLSLESKFNKDKASIDEVFEYDKQKRDMCNKHGIRILYFTNLSGYNYFDKLITSEEELLKEIKNGQELL